MNADTAAGAATGLATRLTATWFDVASHAVAKINNVLAFPGVFRGALDVRASTINEEMKLAAARAIASVFSDDELDPEYSIPSVFNRDVAPAVAAAVAATARASGVASRPRRPAWG